MKRPFALILVALTAIALFAGLVYVALVVAHVSDFAATTVHGPTPRRLWATGFAVLGLASVIIGGLALRRSAGRVARHGRRGAVVAVVAGLVAAVNGGFNLAVATGGLGSGNGVAGGAAALVLGLIAAGLGGVVLARSRRTH